LISNQIDPQLDILYSTQKLFIELSAISILISYIILPGYACSGPSRFDWDVATNGWIYKRTGANLVQLLEKEIGELCHTPVEL
jgi:hypothetical protein